MERSGIMEKVILVGNPGVGKSTILNTVVGSVQFKSGISVGKGLTTVVRDYETGGFIYIDTPGLEDVRTREKAGKEISKALQSGGKIKLIFVMTVESGRLRPSGITTMERTLDAIEAVGIDVSRKFSVIINKVSRAVLNVVLRETDLRIFLSQVCQKYHAGLVDYLAEDDSVKDEDNKMLSATERTKAIIRAAPYISIPNGANINVNTKQYDVIMNEMEEKMHKLREDAAERENIIKRMEMRHARDMRALRISVARQGQEIQAFSGRRIPGQRMGQGSGMAGQRRMRRAALLMNGLGIGVSVVTLAARSAGLHMALAGQGPLANGALEQGSAEHESYVQAAAEEQGCYAQEAGPEHGSYAQAGETEHGSDAYAEETDLQSCTQDVSGQLFLADVGELTVSMPSQTEGHCDTNLEIFEEHADDFWASEGIATAEQFDASEFCAMQ